MGCRTVPGVARIIDPALAEAKPDAIIQLGTNLRFAHIADEAERWQALRESWQVIVLAVTVIGGMAAGVFTATEGAGGAAVVGVLGLHAVMRRALLGLLLIALALANLCRAQDSTADGRCSQSRVLEQAQASHHLSPQLFEFLLGPWSEALTQSVLKHGEEADETLRREKSKNVMYRASEKTGGEKPIDLVRATRPILANATHAPGG